MAKSIRILDPVSGRMACVACGGNEGVSELEIIRGNHAVRTVLCRSCLIQLAHSITSGLVQLDRDDNPRDGTAGDN